MNAILEAFLLLGTAGRGGVLVQALFLMVMGKEQARFTLAGP